MLLFHMQGIVFVDSQESLLSSRGGGGGGGADILAPGLHVVSISSAFLRWFVLCVFAECFFILSQC